jgi:NRPS condensation-like uncharacterized protein
MSSVPGSFPATGTDVAVSITRMVTHHRIGLRLAFDGRLDPERLSRAVRLSLDAEPILGCSFETDAFEASWKRLPDLDATLPFSFKETADPAGVMNAFQAEEVGDAGPQAAVALLRSAAGDELGIKVSHVLADGRAAKQYAYLLADIYTRLGVDPAYAPEPNLAPRPTGRDVWANLTREQRRDAKKAKTWANATWQVPFKGRTGRGLTYRTLALAPARFGAIRAYGKEHDATVNDMMLAAFLRAAVLAFDPPTGVPLSVMCTADLRRYLPDAERLPIANISISGSLDIERADEEFDETLRRVRQRMDAWARTCYGAGAVLGAEKLAGLGYRMTKALLGATLRLAGRSDKTYPWFTNIGVLDEARLAFDGQTSAAGHMYGPSAIGASIVPTVSTYRDTLTVCMGFCEADCDATMIERVLQLTCGELAGR